MMEIRIDTREALRKLDRVPEFVSKNIRSRFRTLGQTLKNELRASMPKGPTGRAARAIFSKMDRRREENDIALLVGGNKAKAPYLGILERGGRIRAKRATMLAIPIGRMQMRLGRTTFTALDLKNSPATYGFERTFVRGDVILGEKPSGEIEPVFALKKELVFSRASAPKPIRTFRDRNEDRIIQEVVQAVTASVQEAQRGGAGTGGGGEE